jgi:hypothetical protein
MDLSGIPARLLSRADDLKLEIRVHKSDFSKEMFMYRIKRHERNARFWSLIAAFALASANAFPSRGFAQTFNPPVVPKAHSSAAQTNAQPLLETPPHLPLRFEANAGQYDERVRFVARAADYALFLKQNGASLVLQNSKPNESAASSDLTRAEYSDLVTMNAKPASSVIGMEFVGASGRAKIEGVERLEGATNYFIGRDAAKWRTSVAAYAKVRYQNIYKGIDALFYESARAAVDKASESNMLEYDFIVQPGADYRKIRLRFTGSERLEIDAASGDLLIHTPLGELRQHRPRVYQLNGEGEREEVASRFVLRGKDEIAFDVAAFDHARPLIIDPSVTYSTYFGGSGNDLAVGIGFDAAGNIYFGGNTTSFDLPLVNPLQRQKTSGRRSIFLVKLNPTGTSVLYSTYLGGNGDDAGFGFAVDLLGNAYITGATNSSNFPVVNGLQSSSAGEYDCFLAKINAQGNALLYSTYLGGNGFDNTQAVAVDDQGNAWIAGMTNSTNFPTKNAAFPNLAGGFDGFLTRINTTQAGASSLVFSTYFGGSFDDFGSGSSVSGNVAVDRAGNAYITSFTLSNNLPLKNPFQAVYGGGSSDIFVAKFDVNGALQYSTYIGGNDNDASLGIAVDSAGSAYIAGVTLSNNFPVVNAFQTRRAGGFDAVVFKLSPAGNALLYSTYLGGAGDESAQRIAVDSSGDAYVTGSTSSTNFPLFNATQTQPAGSGDYFVTEINAAGNGLLFSTLVGGNNNEVAVGIALAPDNTVGLAGNTNSTNYPLVSPVQANLRGVNNAFVTRLSVAPINPIDNPAFFVRQHYIDFLNREPDAAGIDFWMNEIASCNGDAACIDVKRQNVSAAYFLSTEFQETGFYVIRIQRAAFGKVSNDAAKRISFQQFLNDARAVGNGVIVGQPNAQQQLDQNKTAYARAVVSSSDFASRYPTSLSAAAFVDALFATAGVQPSAQERQDAINAFGAGDTAGRAAALRKVAESNSIKNAEFNPAFVLLQYFGYLRRNPTDPPDNSDAGYQFWLNKLNAFGGDYIRSEMVRSFILSSEYRKRFGAS